MHISSRRFSFAIVCLIALMLALPAAAQNRVFKGKVVDDKGQPIVGATVLIQGRESAARKYNTKTDKKGTWIYMGLPDGYYDVGVHAQGFAPNYKPSVRATIQSETEVNLTLVPGSDTKLPFEMTPEEQKQAKEQNEKIEQRKKASGEVQALFEAGNKLADAGSNAEAIESYKKALALDPEQTGVYASIAECYRKMSQYQESLEYYQKAIAIKPDAALYTNMGVVLDKLGKSAEAQEAFKKASTVNPGGSAQSHYNLGATMINSGHTAEAVEAFKQAIAADPNFAEAYYQLGMCLSGKPETMEEAIKNLQQYIKIGQKPEQVDVAKAIIAALEQSLKKK